MSGFGVSPEDWPPFLCETEEELDEAVDYLQARVGIESDRLLFNYGRSHLEEYGGITAENLFEEASRIRSVEHSLAGRESSYSNLYTSDGGDGGWHRPV
ncbi:MAG: hypothetical protein ABEK10_05020 [Candidatus Nanosalina sp.]